MHCLGDFYGKKHNYWSGLERPEDKGIVNNCIQTVSFNQVLKLCLRTPSLCLLFIENFLYFISLAKM